MPMRRYFVLTLFLLLSVGGGLLSGLYNLPGEWYAGLAKPPFNPPNWIFGPVWTVLYVLIGIAGWRTWERRYQGVAMQLWFGQMALNFAWSPVFFTWHAIGIALAIIVALLLAVVAFITVSWRRDRLSAWLFVPYAVWVAFATMLNASLLFLNP